LTAQLTFLAGPPKNYRARRRKAASLERLIWGFGDGSTLPVYDTPARKARRPGLLGELHAAPADGNVREAIISPLGQVLAGPLFNEDAILLAEVDLAEIARGKYDFDVVGHYARPDVFRLHVNENATPPVIVD
jgi:hypothetical protein